jgi:two-component system sensor histidine kinase BaeS
VRLEVAAADNLPLVEVDPERMAQVLGNLVNNALRYTPAGGVVRLAAHADGETVCLTVRDTGPGIAPEELPLIFERFYRRDKARTANGESGLGLPIAKSLVETHGGTLTAASPPGEGAMFTITLPAERISGLPSLTEQGLG